MARRGNWKKRMQGKIVDEAAFIKKAFRDAPPPYRKIIKVVSADDGIGFMYAEGEILVREEYVDRVLAILGQPNLRRLQRRSPDRVPQVISGVRLLTLSGGAFPTVLRTRRRMGALERIEELIGQGIATPNQVLTVSGGTGSHCPATEPEEVYDEIEPYPSVCQANSGASPGENAVPRQLSVVPHAPPTSAPSVSRAARASSRGIAAPVATNVRSVSGRSPSAVRSARNGVAACTNVTP